MGLPDRGLSARVIRILALVTEAFGGRGGIAQYNRDFLSAVTALGADITVIARFASPQFECPTGVRQLGAKSTRTNFVISTLAVAIRKRPDIVFCGHVYMAPLGAIVARLFGAKLIVQMHGIDAWTLPSALVRHAVETAEMILCVSRFTRERVLCWARVQSERALVLPNTFSPQFSSGDINQFREKWGIVGKTVILTVGRLDPRERYKGHEQVIKCIPSLVQAGWDITYVVTGDGADRRRLEDIARNAGVFERVVFTGELSRTQLIEAYRAADAFVMASTGEGFGIAYLEAMACGVPVVSLAAGGAPDALCDGVLGVLVHNLGELDEGIKNALTSAKPNIAREVEAHFGVSVYRAQVGRIFHRLVSDS